MTIEPQKIACEMEQQVSVPEGQGDRFAGYAVIGLPFRSGHVLALRRFPASSLGPGYTSVWHRNPLGVWTFYSTVAREKGCSRYFSDEVTNDYVTPIELDWDGPSKFRVLIPERGLRWEVALTESLSSRMMNAVGSLVPESWWRNKRVLAVMGAAARYGLGTGKMNLSGRTPNGQQFIANPQRLWLIESSRAIVNGRDLGPPGALEKQARLSEFLIPQRGLFAIARAYLGADATTN